MVAYRGQPPCFYTVETRWHASHGAAGPSLIWGATWKLGALGVDCVAIIRPNSLVAKISSRMSTIESRGCANRCVQQGDDLWVPGGRPGARFRGHNVWSLGEWPKMSPPRQRGTTIGPAVCHGSSRPGGASQPGWRSSSETEGESKSVPLPSDWPGRRRIAARPTSDYPSSSMQKAKGFLKSRSLDPTVGL